MMLPDDSPIRDLVNVRQLELTPEPEPSLHNFVETSGGRTLNPDFSGLPLALGDWLSRDLPEPDYLLGEWLATTSRALLTGTTGLGKTNLMMAMSFAVAAGTSFLHWRGHRPRKVLYIDGEMSRRLFRQRLADAARRAGCRPEGLFALSREDVPDMPPLNTMAGQAFVDALIDRIGGPELVTFDNIQALLVGDMKDEAQWQDTLPWIRSLTRRGIGQIWGHHTGHDESRAYGSKAREWQLDTSILIERDDSGADLAFRLKFTKARERRSDNRADFEPAAIALVDDEWVSDRITAAATRHISPLASKFLQALVNALAEHGDLRGRSVPSVSLDKWRSECARQGLIDPLEKRDSARALFNRYRRELVAAERVVCDHDLAWLPK